MATTKKHTVTADLLPPAKAPSPANLILLAEQEFNEELKAKQVKHQERIEKLLNGVKKELEMKLGEALAVFNSIPETQRKTVLSEPSFSLVIESLGLQPKSEEPTKGKSRQKKSELSEEKVLAFIGTGEKSKGELYAEFSGGNKKVAAVLDGLVSAKKLKVTERAGKGKPAQIYSKA